MLLLLNCEYFMSLILAVSIFSVNIFIMTIWSNIFPLSFSLCSSASIWDFYSLSSLYTLRSIKHCLYIYISYYIEYIVVIGLISRFAIVCVQFLIWKKERWELIVSVKSRLGAFSWTIFRFSLFFLNHFNLLRFL